MRLKEIYEPERLKYFACVGKTRHDTAAGAARELKKCLRKKDMNIYKCHFCNGYHIGHNPENPTNRKRRK